MSKCISLYKVLTYDNEETMDLRNQAFNACREFVASSARGNRRERIRNARIDRIPIEGILRRLEYNPETGHVSYCAGQDYVNELGILRNIFDRRGW